MMKMRYEMKNGEKCLVIKLDNNEKLNKFVYSMLANNSIPGVIRPEFENRKDDGMVMLYNLDGMVPISQFMTFCGNRQMAGSLRTQLMSLWNTLDEYMLSDRYFIWNKDYIYADCRTGKIGVMCVGAEHPSMIPLDRKGFLEYLLQLSGAERYLAAPVMPDAGRYLVTSDMSGAGRYLAATDLSDGNDETTVLNMDIGMENHVQHTGTFHSGMLVDGQMKSQGLKRSEKSWCSETLRTAAATKSSREVRKAEKIRKREEHRAAKEQKKQKKRQRSEMKKKEKLVKKEAGKEGRNGSETTDRHNGKNAGNTVKVSTRKNGEVGLPYRIPMAKNTQ